MASIPDLFSGYINGREKAIQSNWNDLNQYNKVLGGQMQNAYSMATFDPAVRKDWNSAQQSDYQTIAQAQGLDNILQSNALAQQAGVPQLAVNANVAQLQASLDALNKQKQALDLQIQQLQQQLKQNQANSQQTQASANLPQVPAVAPGSTNSAPAITPVVK